MKLKALREKRAKIVADMEEIIQSAESEDRIDLDATEAELYAELETELSQVKAAIERRESFESEKADLGAVTDAIARKQGAGSNPPPGPEAKRDFGSIGEFMGAVIQHARGRGTDQRLTFVDGAGMSAQDGQRMDEGASGGFLVPTQFRGEILRVEPQEAVIRGRSRVIEPGTPPDAEITMPALDQTGDAPDNVYGGVEMNWIGEGDTKPDTEAKFREISWTPQELAGNIPLTDKLMRNAPAMSSMVEQLMRQALIAAQETAFLRGDGVGKPLGMLHAGATVNVNRDTANEVKYEDLSDMVAKLLMRGNPYWMISQSAYSQLVQLQDPNGGYVWQPNAVEGSPGSLFGYPVFWHERSPQLGSRGDVVLTSSDPYYVIKDGSGPFVAAGFAGNDFIQNRTRIKVFTNVDAKPWLTEPFKQEGGYEVSPFVALDVPSQ